MSSGIHHNEDPSRLEVGNHPRRRASTVLAVLAGLALLACVYFGVGPRGDISYRSGWRGMTIEAYLHPQVEHPELDVDFVDLARLCNEDAVHKMHQVFVLLPAGVVLGLVAVALRRRRMQS